MNHKNTEPRAIIVEHRIKTRIIIDIPTNEIPDIIKDENEHVTINNNKISKSTINKIVRITHQKMRHNTNTDSAYPYMDNIESIKPDSEKPYDPDNDSLTSE